MLDDFFPNPLSAFRFEEFNYYLDHFPDAEVHTTCELGLAWSKQASASQILAAYAAEHPHRARRVRQFRQYQRLNASVCYCNFLYLAHRFIPFVERIGAGLVFTLYPGGNFALDQPASDAALARVCASKNLRRVIATQQLVVDYLVDKKFCSPEKIELVYGGVFPPQQPSSDRPKKEGHTIDVGFAALKYTPRGEDKGYDVFVDTALRLARQDSRFRFHVVGTFTAGDIDVTELGDRISFYGPLVGREFHGVLRRMDLILSPNAPFKLGPGAFDGFPTGCCTEAALQGVAVFCADELKMNRELRDGEEIVLIPRDAAGIADIVRSYADRPGALESLAARGEAAFRRLYAIEAQMGPRVRVLEEAMREHSSPRRAMT